MSDDVTIFRYANLKKYKIIYISIFFSILIPTKGLTQQVRNIYEKITDNFNQNSYYTTLNLCRTVIKICETTPEPECWYTNIMKDIYRYKGITEFEIYKKELKKKRLADAIESLTVSYNLFRDPEVQFLRGYLHSLNAILLNKRTDLTGLVIAWESLLNLYARNSWHVSADVADKIKLFIRVAEKFCDPIPPKNYSGAFAKFIIVMACDLAEKGDLPKSERKIFEEIRLKYYNDDGEQWQKWRSNGYTPK